MIKISVTVSVKRSDAWAKWKSVEGIQYWSFASDEWAAEGIENDVRPGGRFRARNFAKDGSAEFIFEWIYDEVDPEHFITSTMPDGRKVRVSFTDVEEGTRIDQAFDPETENPEEFQRAGWQAYLDNFKKFAESTNTSNLGK